MQFECEMMSESRSALQKFTISRSVAPENEGILVVEGAGVVVQIRIDDRDARQILEEILSFLGFPAEASSVETGVIKLRPA